MDVTTGAMVPLLHKLAELPMEEYKLQRGVRGDIQFLRAEMESMYAALRMVAKVPREQLDEQVRFWAMQVRELSYNMEDALDDFMVMHVDGSDPAVDGLLKKATNLLKKGKTRHQFTDVIRNMKVQIEKAAARRDIYRIDGVVAYPATRYRIEGVDANPVATTTVVPPQLALHKNEKVADLIGMEGPRDELIQMLTEGDDISKHQMRIVSIVGSGGSGKTVLARMVYQELEAHFDCMAFVSAGLKPDLKKIFKEMAHLLGMKNYVDTLEEGQLIDKIGGFLWDKRYLIVIDDLWDRQDWDEILRSLVVNDRGSRVITTTRVNSIAKMCCSGDDKLIYEIKHLGYLNSKRLLLKIYFGSEVSCPDALTEVVDEILEMCGGMPLAIISIASLLATKVEAKEPWQDVMNSLHSYWKEMMSSLQSGREDIPALEDLRKSLSKSCINLPGNLKTCLLYLATSAKNQRVQRDNLVRKWIAEGFIPEDEEYSREEVAARYFDDLINRNVIQPVEYDNCLGKGTYQVNHMMLYVLRLISHYEQFVTFLSDFGISGPDVMPVRLSIQRSIGTEVMDLSHVRSITILGPTKSVSFKQLEYLQMLDVDGCEDLDNTDVDVICRMNLLKYLSLKQTRVTCLPPQIGNLRFLETLDVSRTQISVLPPQIGKLQNLETLDVRQTQVKELPKELVQLPKIARLCFGQSSSHGGTKLPSGSDQLKSVKVLGIVDSRECSESVMEEISQLGEVREVEVVLYDGPADEKQNDKLLFSIGKCSNLQYLTIHGDSNPSGELPTTTIFPRLEKLKVSGRFAKVPRWIETLSVLTLLDIRVCKLGADDLIVLGKLPGLRSLALALVSLPREQVVITKSAAFLSLEVFTFDCRVPWITFEQEVMPNLKHIRLKVYACKANRTLLGIMHLQSLNKVTLRYPSQYASSDGVFETVTVMKEAAASHANLIVLSINDSQEIFLPNKRDGQELYQSYEGMTGTEIEEDLASM